MSEFPAPFFELGDRVMVYSEDPALAPYNGQIGRVLDTCWMSSTDADEMDVAGWQYQVCIPVDTMNPLEGVHTTLLWCAESMLYVPHEAGLPFSALMEELQAAPPHLAGERFEKLVDSIKAWLPFPTLEMNNNGDEFLPNERCGCGRPVRYIMGRVDAPILSCNRIRRCPSVHLDPKGDRHDQDER